MSQSLVAALAVVLAIIGTVLGIIFFFPKKNRDKFGKFGTVVHDFLNFKTLVIDYVLKAMYIFATIFTVVAGFFYMFSVTTTYESVYKQGQVFPQRQAVSSMSINNVITGLLIMILGPIAIRLFYELIMLAVVAVKNVMEINKKLPEVEEPEVKEPATPMEPVNPTEEEKIVEAAENSSEY